MHHAKSDVSYTLLAKISADVDEKHPHLKLQCRGNGDVRSLEYTESMPPTLTEISETSMQFPWERTLEIRRGKEMLESDPSAGVAKIAETVVGNALYCCTKADRALLRELHDGMELHRMRQAADHPVPIAHWKSTVLSERNAEYLRVNWGRVEAEVRRVATGVGAKLPKIKSEKELKDNYLDFFVALVDTMVTSEQQELFMQRYAKSFGIDGKSIKRSTLLARLREYLESPVPQDFERMDHRQIRLKNAKTGYSLTRRRVQDLLFGIRSKL